MKHTVSPGCTTGPYFPVEFSDGSEDLTQRDGRRAQGQPILLTGQVLELGNVPTRNMVVEIWQADANGIFRHPLDPRQADADPGFWGWGRARTNKEGWYRFRTVFPGVTIFPGDTRAPHLNVAILGIGLTRRLVTTVFFSEDPDAGIKDAVLDCVPAALRCRLLPRREPALDADGAWAYRWNVILRGEGETPFFLD
jgi:protocatechuate 3,4-dioxygenase alpha subunit